jgi:hypothetical protein
MASEVSMSIEETIIEASCSPRKIYEKRTFRKGFVDT